MVEILVIRTYGFCLCGQLFSPKMKEPARKHLWAGWKEAVGRVLLK